LRTPGPIWLILFLNVCNSPNQVFIKKKIGKVDRKIGKFGKSLVLFSMRTAGTIWLFFFNIRNNSNEKNWESCPENWKIREKLQKL
jgi:hypothetical protein